MKQAVFFFIPILMATDLYAQAPITKIYAYKQTVLQGKRPEPQEELKTRENFFIYFTAAKNSKPAISGMWIGGDYYEVKTNRLAKTPVTQTVFGEDNKVLVPSTKQDVYQIELKKKNKPVSKPGAALSNHLGKNELVLVYSYKGKQYFSTAKKIEELPAMPMY